MHMKQLNKFCLSYLLKDQTVPRFPPRIRNSIDLFEFRLDLVPTLNIERLLKEYSDKEIILTLRSKEEGGFWSRNPDQMIDIYRKAINLGVSYLDVELSLADEILPRIPNFKKTRIILSHHTQDNSEKNLERILTRMLEMNTDVVKLIFTARALNDNLIALNLLKKLKSVSKTGIIHAMGEAGRLSRILGAVYGNAWTYVCTDQEEETAPGQLTLEDAIQNYYLKDRKEFVNILGLIGYPIKQSFGWIIHNELIHRKKNFSNMRSIQNDWIYLNFPVKDVERFLNSWRDEISGLSVTIPHKERVVKFLDFSSPEVIESGVCNTMVKRDGLWYGYNTDMLAIVELLTPFRKQLANAPVLIIGTGGTARSSIAALKRLKIANILVSGRNQIKGKELAASFNVEFKPLESLTNVLLSGIIQTTPVGMFPNINQVSCPPDLLKKGIVVLDVIYNPVKTRLLQMAEERGCHIISGLEMYFLQAKHQFMLFTGLETNEQEIRDIWETKVNPRIN